MARARLSGPEGFTLLEVLIAFAILAVAVVSLIQLTSQSLRLLKVSGDHQEAVQIADRIARDTQVNTDELAPDAATVETGEEGQFAWERRIERLPMPEELERRTADAASAQVPGLYAVSVAVRWGRNHSVEVATLRAPAPVSAATEESPSPADEQGQTPGQGTQTPGQGSRTPGQTGQTPAGAGTQPGRTQTGPFGSRDGGRTPR